MCFFVYFKFLALVLGFWFICCCYWWHHIAQRHWYCDEFGMVHVCACVCVLNGCTVGHCLHSLRQTHNEKPLPIASIYLCRRYSTAVPIRITRQCTVLLLIDYSCTESLPVLLLLCSDVLSCGMCSTAASMFVMLYSVCGCQNFFFLNCCWLGLSRHWKIVRHNVCLFYHGLSVAVCCWGNWSKLFDRN